MVFKAIAGVPGRIAGYWKLPYLTSECSLEALNKKNSYKKFYKNRIVQNWDKFSPKEVRQMKFDSLMLYRFNVSSLCQIIIVKYFRLYAHRFSSI